MNKNPITNGNTRAKKLQSVLKVFAVAIVIVSIWILCQTLQRPLATMDSFQVEMEAQGFSVEKSGEADYALAAKGNTVIEYSLVGSRESAQYAAQMAIAWCEEEHAARSTANSESANNHREYLKSSETFFIVHQYENVLFYASADIGDAAIIKAIDKALMPGNAVLAFMLLVLGTGFAGFATVFLAQAVGKQKRCNAPAVATVVRNEQKRTLDKRNAYTFSYSPVLSFYANGVQQEVVYGNGFPKPLPEDEKVEIFYQDGNPEELRFANRQKERLFRILAVAFILVGLGLISLGCIVLR